MNPQLLDILACPADGGAPLEIGLGAGGPNGERLDALLRCPTCGSVFVVLKGIPHLVRPALRRVEREREALNNVPAARIDAEWRDALERSWAESETSRSEADRMLLEEGDYWSEFFQIHFDLGALTIFDARIKGTHLPYLPIGIHAADERDRWRLHDSWPDALGRRILRFFDETRAAGAQRYLDLGCGGGQFGLEAAWRGAQTVGVDVAVGALELGRRHAMEKGLDANYVYAEPSRLPFRSGVFDALAVKDAFHHLPDALGAVRETARLMRPGAQALIIEHVGNKPRWEWLGRKIRERLTPALFRRYGRGEAPALLQRLSPLEALGRPDLEPILSAELEIEERRGELLFADEYALPVYLATGRRRQPAAWMAAAVYRLERVAMLWGGPRFLFLRGRFRPAAGSDARQPGNRPR